MDILRYRAAGIESSADVGSLLFIGRSLLRSGSCLKSCLEGARRDRPAVPMPFLLMFCSMFQKLALPRWRSFSARSKGFAEMLSAPSCALEQADVNRTQALIFLPKLFALRTADAHIQILRRKYP